MAKLVAVCRDDEFPFERRQIPLMIEESLTMVMEIPETVISAECVTSADVSQFTKRYGCLSHSEMNAALMVGQKELFSLLAISVPCVGCRRSVERLYNQLWESGQPAIEPLVIAASGVLTLSESFLVDAKLIYALFYIHGSHLNDIVDTIPKSKRNRRCILHSLETHKARASGWMDVWDLLSQECRDEVVLIDSDSLMDTLEGYLRKHRFCSECKSKVLKAYSILAGDIDGDAEKGYCAGLYDGLKSCPKERHIHVVCDTDFIAHLIGRAEPELAGGRRERHARTIDIAQEEVLTCLGIHLWERLHRLWQKLRAEEQTWQMLFYLGVEALRKSFETAVEDKQGISQLELVVEEISEAERVKEQRKENKRLKKKKRKENKAKLNEEKCQQEEKSQCYDNDEKCLTELSEDTCLEYAESIDSEKSSSESQPSPHKIDGSELESSSDTPSDISLKRTSSSSCGSSLDEKSSGLLKCISNESITLTQSERNLKASCSRNSQNSLCNSTTSNTNKSNNQVSCKTAPSSCHMKNTSEKLTVKPCTDQPCKNTDSVPYSDTKHVCQSEEKSQRPSSKSPEICKCDSTNGNPKLNKRNGYTNHQEYRKSVYNHKKNGYHSDCRVCNPSNVGPRFNRHEDQSRWKGGDHNDYHSGDVYDKCHSINGNLHNGRGRGKRKILAKEKGATDFIQRANDPKHRTENDQQRYGKNSYRSDDTTSYSSSSSSTCTSVDVEDEDELRLLKMMGWTVEDSHDISEQDIREFSANVPEVQTKREELRDKLREQFDKLCVSKVFSR